MLLDTRSDTRISMRYLRPPDQKNLTLENQEHRAGIFYQNRQIMNLWRRV